MMEMTKGREPRTAEGCGGNRMKRKIEWVLVSLVTVFALSVPIVSTAEDDICWRETNPRGTGTIPRQCDLVEERKVLTCYELCPEGYTGLIAKCRADCPPGYTEGVLNYCRKAESYRVEGFGWKAGDGLGPNRLLKARQRCEQKYGRGSCEQRQLAWYPSCRETFTNAGINICSQTCPEGWKEEPNRCERPSFVREKSRTECEEGKEYGAGLCRDLCPDGYNGVGPVCWAECPASFPERCGMACATSREACATAVTDQVMSVFEVVVSLAAVVATGGASTAAKGVSGVAKTAAKQGAKQALKEAGKSIGNMSKSEIAEVLAGVVAVDMLQETVDAVYAVAAGDLADDSPGEKSLEVFAALDPTGITSVVAAYKKPICPLPGESVIQLGDPQPGPSLFELGSP